jgi:hypothetical protein
MQREIFTGTVVQRKRAEKKQQKQPSKFGQISNKI